MTATLNVWASAGARIDGRALPLGSHAVPTSISVTGNVHRRRDVIANGANSTMYSDELGRFSFGWIEADFNTRVLLTDTQSATFSLPVRGTGTAGVYGMPLFLPNDVTTNSNVTINSIQVFNDSGSDATVNVVIIE